MLLLTSGEEEEDPEAIAIGSSQHSLFFVVVIHIGHLTP